MSNRKLKIGLLGAGYISDWHADAAARAGAEIAAVCDRSEAAAKSFAAGRGINRIYTDLDAMLSDGGLDVIHVLTPPNAHMDCARMILDAGVAAFVEKPFTLSSADCAALADLAAQRNVALGVNHNFLMLPAYERLKRDIASGVMGPIDSLDANWRFPLQPFRSGPFNLWMLRKPENILFEIGSHLFAFVADLFDDVEILSAEPRYPIAMPGGARQYQGWRIEGRSGEAAIGVNLSLIEGQDDRSVRARGLGALAEVDFANDCYRRDQSVNADIVIGPLQRQLGLAAGAAADGVANAARQLASLNALTPYGLSIARAVASFHRSVRDAAPVDPRLAPQLAERAIAMIEATVEKASPAIKAPAPTEGASRASAPSSAAATGKTMLVIGGAGFIGRALTSALADKGHRVRVFSRGRPDDMLRADGRVEIFTGGLKSENDLKAALEGVDGVFHLAKALGDTWADYVENDVKVTQLIGQCVADTPSRPRLVYTGTIDSYDASDPDRAITEETPFDEDLEGRNLYARSKAACEAALMEIAKDAELKLVIVRPGIVIGRGGPLQHWGIAKWSGSTSCTLWGSGDNTLPFVLVEDVAEGLVQAMEADGVDGRSFNLIGEPMLSAKQYFDEVGRANGVKMRAAPKSIWSYYVVDLIKYALKTTLARKKNVSKPTYRDWKSRTQLSPYANGVAKEVLGWRPEADRAAFIRRGIVDANLFGLLSPDRNATPAPIANEDRMAS
ncbi:MAG: NAD-dependent epimerase/dehydratase family protein [Pseudomonadota bacterium]